MSKKQSSPLTPEIKVEPKISDIQTEKTTENFIADTKQNVQWFLENNSKSPSTDSISTTTTTTTPPPTTNISSHSQENRNRDSKINAT